MIFRTAFDNDGISQISMDTPATRFRTRGTPLPTKVFWSDTGYLNDDIIRLIMEDFIEQWQIAHTGVHCMLIGDNLKSHHQIPVLRLALQNLIYMTFLVADTTHWSQPLDNLLFAELKAEVARITDQRAYEQEFIEQNIFCYIDIILKATQFAFRPSVVKKAFCDTGLCPFSPDKIHALADFHYPVDNGKFLPTNEHEYLVEQGTRNVQKVFMDIRNKAGEESQKIEKFMAKHQFQPSMIVNYDKSRVVLSVDKKVQVKRLVSKDKSKPQHRPHVFVEPTVAPFSLL